MSAGRRVEPFGARDQAGDQADVAGLGHDLRHLEELRAVSGGQLHLDRIDDLLLERRIDLGIGHRRRRTRPSR